LVAAATVLVLLAVVVVGMGTENALAPTHIVGVTMAMPAATPAMAAATTAVGGEEEDIRGV
jgi:hypothetical protein